MSEEKHHRKIQSFVRREGRITPRQQKALASLWPKYGIDHSKEKIDINDLFSQAGPIVIEIGFGNGHTLLEMAKAYPTNNYVGIEVHRPGVGGLLADIDEAGITNLKLFCHDAVEVLKDCIAENSIDKFQIFFPDPWHKKRHNKRRLIQPEFVSVLVSKLKEGGCIHLATDWEDYAMQMLEVCQANTDLINAAGHDKFLDTETDRPTTKFERRGQRLGHGVWDLQFIKRKA